MVDRSTCHSFRDSALLPILLFSIHLIRLYHAAFNVGDGDDDDDDGDYFNDNDHRKKGT